LGNQIAPIDESQNGKVIAFQHHTPAAVVGELKTAGFRIQLDQCLAAFGLSDKPAKALSLSSTVAWVGLKPSEVSSQLQSGLSMADRPVFLVSPESAT